MKNNRVILIITLVLALVAFALLLNNKSATIKGELRDFAVKDIASVSKIFLADKKKNTILLERQPDGSWTVNGKYKARKDAVDLLLETMSHIDVQSPVAKAAQPNVLKDLASGGVKVEIYQHNEKSKTYYVGGGNQELTGTFMLLEHSSVPFIMYIPGFNGYLTTRYFTDEKEWRSRAVFDYMPQEIKKITLNYTYTPNSSFSLERIGNGFKLIAIATNKVIEDADTAFCNAYIGYYKNKNFEGFVKPQTNKDSVLKATPILVISVLDMQGKSKNVKFYSKANEGELRDEKGKLYEHDIERMHANIDNSNDLMLVQLYVFDKLFKSPTDFARPATKMVKH
jgi:hypothetical protein